MDPLPPAVLLPLLHGSAMLLFPCVMGLATALALGRAPSPFSVVSVHERFLRRGPLDRVWLAGSCGLLLVALARGAADWNLSSAALVVAFAAPAAAAVALAAESRIRPVLADELAEAAARVLAEGPVTTVDGDGTLVAQRRESRSNSSLAGAPRAAAGYLASAAASLGLFAGASVFAATAAPDSWPAVARCLLLAGFWVSLGVLLNDLVEDSWPGFSSNEGIARTSRYYVQIFEQSPNFAVLAAFLVVLAGAPAAWAAGCAPAEVLAFPSWIDACLGVATFTNGVLVPRGIVRSTLPLPMRANRYSVSHPLWAHFFAVIHLVMAAALLWGIAGLHGAMQ